VNLQYVWPIVACAGLEMPPPTKAAEDPGLKVHRFRFNPQSKRFVIQIKKPWDFPMAFFIDPESWEGLPCPRLIYLIKEHLWADTFGLPPPEQIFIACLDRRIHYSLHLNGRYS
jgi:hypothetical protein